MNYDYKGFEKATQMKRKFLADKFEVTIHVLNQAAHKKNISANLAIKINDEFPELYNKFRIKE